MAAKTESSAQKPENTFIENANVPHTETEEAEKPDIEEYIEDSGYSVSELEEVYDRLEPDNYIINEENNDVLLEKSKWNEVKDILEAEDETNEPNEIEKYLGQYKNDAAWIGGGLTGAIAGSQLYGWGLAASGTAMVAGALTGIGGLAAAGAGIYSATRKYMASKATEEEEPETNSEKHELSEYAESEVKIFDKTGLEDAYSAYSEKIEENNDSEEED